MQRIAIVFTLLLAGCKSPAKTVNLNLNVASVTPMFTTTSLSLKVER